MNKKRPDLVLLDIYIKGTVFVAKYGAAELLDIKPTTLEARMLKLGIKRDK